MYKTLWGLLHREKTRFLLALQFLTRLPVPNKLDYTPAEFGAARYYFPLVGAVIGAIGAFAYGTAILLGLSPMVAALLATAATLLSTGAFHEDGLADTFDGLGTFTREKFLIVMSDSRIGTFGAVALGLTIALKVTAIGSMPLKVAMVCLVVGHGLSRISNVIVAATSTYVRTPGAGSFMTQGLGLGGLAVVATTGIACFASVVFVSPSIALCSLTGMALGHVGMRCLYERRLGGHTGDTQGAVQQWSELGFYLGALVCL